MVRIWKSDLYRMGKNKLLYIGILCTCTIGIILMMLNHRDIRIGVSVVGNLTSFRKAEDIIKLGISYQKGLGIIIGILIALFIGEEYQWKTWQNKCTSIKNRIYMYLSKLLIACMIAIGIPLAFQITVALSGGYLEITQEYFVNILISVFVYGALGAVLCMFSMLIKHQTIAVIVCLIYVVFSETIVSIVKQLASLSNITDKLITWLINHSIYGMSVIATNNHITPTLACEVVINAILMIGLSTGIGVWLFNQYEL